MSTRRAFVAGAALAVVAGRPAVARAELREEARIIESALRLEQTAVHAYDAVVRGGAVDEPLALRLGALRDHEQAHADALAAALEALGGRRPPAPADDRQADEALAELGIPFGIEGARDATTALELLLALELRQVEHYTRAVGELEDVRLIQTAASVVAAEGQHLVVIREALRRASIPTPLEPGGG